MGAVLDDAEQHPLVWAKHGEIPRLVLAGMPWAQSAQRVAPPIAGAETARRMARLAPASQAPFSSGEHRDAAYLTAAPAVR
jgi:hypothetical protein